MHEWEGEVVRVGEGEQLKQAPCSTWSSAQDVILQPRDHDMSQNQEAYV